MSIDVRINIEEDFSFRQALQKEIAERFSAFLTSINTELKREIKKLVGEALEDSPEYQSILGGILREHFGIANPGEVLAEIVQFIKSTVAVRKTSPAGFYDIGGIQAAVLADVYELLGLKASSYISYSKRNGELIIPWLSWLLLDGDELIIADYEINFDKSRASSRTGNAIMVKAGKNRRSRGWKVPNQFSGTVGNNWISRSLEPVIPKIQALVYSTCEDFFR